MVNGDSHGGGGVQGQGLCGRDQGSSYRSNNLLSTCV